MKASTYGRIEFNPKRAALTILPIQSQTGMHSSFILNTLLPKSAQQKFAKTIENLCIR